MSGLHIGQIGKIFGRAQRARDRRPRLRRRDDPSGIGRSAYRLGRGEARAGTGAVVSRRRQPPAGRRRARSSSAKAFASSARTRSRRNCWRRSGRSARAPPRARPKPTRASARRFSPRCRRSTPGRASSSPTARVIAIEAAEGTDAMLARVAELEGLAAPALPRAGGRLRQGAQARSGLAPRHAGRRPADDRGRQRARNCRASRSPPAAVLIADRARRLRARADEAGLFVVGFAP